MKKTIQLTLVSTLLLFQGVKAEENIKRDAIRSQELSRFKEGFQMPATTHNAKREPCIEIQFMGKILKQSVDALQKDPTNKDLIDNIYLRSTEIKHKIDQFPECSKK